LWATRRPKPTLPEALRVLREIASFPSVLFLISGMSADLQYAGGGIESGRKNTGKKLAGSSPGIYGATDTPVQGKCPGFSGDSVGISAQDRAFPKIFRGLRRGWVFPGGYPVYPQIRPVAPGPPTAWATDANKPTANRYSSRRRRPLDPTKAGFPLDPGLRPGSIRFPLLRRPRSAFGLLVGGGNVGCSALRSAGSAIFLALGERLSTPLSS